MIRKRLTVRAATGLLLIFILVCLWTGLKYDRRAGLAEVYWKSFEENIESRRLGDYTSRNWLTTEELKRQLQGFKESHAANRRLSTLSFIFAGASLVSIWLLWFLAGRGRPKPEEETPPPPAPSV